MGSISCLIEMQYLYLNTVLVFRRRQLSIHSSSFKTVRLGRTDLSLAIG